MMIILTDSTGKEKLFTTTYTSPRGASLFLGGETDALADDFEIAFNNWYELKKLLRKDVKMKLLTDSMFPVSYTHLTLPTILLV